MNSTSMKVPLVMAALLVLALLLANRQRAVQSLRRENRLLRAELAQAESIQNSNVTLPHEVGAGTVTELMRLRGLIADMRRDILELRRATNSLPGGNENLEGNAQSTPDPSALIPASDEFDPITRLGVQQRAVERAHIMQDLVQKKADQVSPDLETRTRTIRRLADSLAVPIEIRQLDPQEAASIPYLAQFQPYFDARLENEKFQIQFEVVQQELISAQAETLQTELQLPSTEEPRVP